MFVKPLSKYNKKTDERYTVYQLCESYRLGGCVRHHIIVGLGKLEEQLSTVEQIKMLGRRIEEKLKRSPIIPFDTIIDEKIEQLAEHFFQEIKKRKRYDFNRDWETIDTKTLKNKDAREIGAEWLSKQAFEQLAIADFLKKKGWDEEKTALATTHIISRAVYPASELKTVSFIKENSAVCELTNYEKDKITKDRLYRISQELYSVKDDLERYLSSKTNELFDIEDKIIIYDLTNTYFEGRMLESKIARYGRRSKEKRKDAKLIVLAVVVNREGFLKYSNIFEGNMSDSKTLGTIVKELSTYYKIKFTFAKNIANGT